MSNHPRYTHAELKIDIEANLRRLRQWIDQMRTLPISHVKGIPEVTNHVIERAKLIEAILERMELSIQDIKEWPQPEL